MLALMKLELGHSLKPGWQIPMTPGCGFQIRKRILKGFVDLLLFLGKGKCSIFFPKLQAEVLWASEVRFNPI